MITFFKTIWRYIKKGAGFVWRLLRTNLHLKIIAVIFAFIIWSYVIGAENPTRTMTVRDVKVSITGMTELKEKGYVIDTAAIEDEVDVKISAPQNVHKNISRDTVKASIDVSGFNAAGTQSLEPKIEVSVGSATVQSVSPGKITFDVQKLMTKEVPVEWEMSPSSSLPAGYYMDDPVIEPGTITISGPQKVIESVDKGMVTVNVAGYTNYHEKSYAVRLMDGNQAISHDAIEDDLPSVIVKVNIYRKATVNRKSVFDAVQNIKEGYEITGISIDPTEVAIAGDAAVIESVDEVKVKMISAENADTSVFLEAELEPIEGVTFVKGNKVTLFVQIAEKQETRVFEDIAIRIENQNTADRITLSEETTDVTITGSISLVQALARGDIVVYINVTGLSKGTHEVTVRIEELQGIKSEDIDLEHASVTITIA